MLGVCLYRKVTSIHHPYPIQVLGAVVSVAMTLTAQVLVVPSERRLTSPCESD